MESVDYGKALDWDDEVEYSEPEFTLLPPGDYNFTVTGFEREHYPGGQKLPACDKAVFFITIEVPEGKTTIKHNFFMLEYMKGYVVYYFAGYRSGEQLWEIDKRNMKCVIKGKDYMAEVRKALGK